MKKGQEYSGKVRQLAFPNKGIADVDGIDVVVKNTIPGQEVSFILNKNKPGLKEGRLTRILKRSELECMAGCSVHDRCGGCIYQTIGYEDELKLKEQMILSMMDKALKGLGISVYDIYEGITGSPVSEGYRNKMEFSFGNEVKDGPLTLGMHVSGHYMDVIDTQDCNIVDPDFLKIRQKVEEFAKEQGLPFYNRLSNTGYLRNLLIRKGRETGEILVDLVTSSECCLRDDLFVEVLRDLDLEGSITGILNTINDSVSDAVKDDDTRVLYGRDHIYDVVLGYRFGISVFSFFQTNTLGAGLLYSKVREYITGIGKQNGGIVYDLYSGTGTIAQIVSDAADRVYGIEIVPEAVEAARKNAEYNGIRNVSFLCGDVFKTLDEVEEKPEIIILDPPRDGVSPKALAKILAYGVDNIIYIACKPTSLARDLPVFYKEGYIPARMSVIDMFPRTANMEVVSLLQKTGSTRERTIAPDADMEDCHREKTERS